MDKIRTYNKMGRIKALPLFQISPDLIDSYSVIFLLFCNGMKSVTVLNSDNCIEVILLKCQEKPNMSRHTSILNSISDKGMRSSKSSSK